VLLLQTTIYVQHLIIRSLMLFMFLNIDIIYQTLFTSIACNSIPSLTLARLIKEESTTPISIPLLRIIFSILILYCLRVSTLLHNNSSDNNFVKPSHR
jgi:hypothetical protein